MKRRDFLGRLIGTIGFGIFSSKSCIDYLQAREQERTQHKGYVEVMCSVVDGHLLKQHYLALDYSDNIITPMFYDGFKNYIGFIDATVYHTSGTKKLQNQKVEGVALLFDRETWIQRGKSNYLQFGLDIKWVGTYNSASLVKYSIFSK